METHTQHEVEGPRWYQRRILKVPIWALGLILIAAVAVAAIILRAEISGSADSGAEVQFNFATTTDAGATFGDGSVFTNYMVDSDGDGDWDTRDTVPAPLTCTAAIVGGELQVTMGGGWLPGEGCGLATNAAGLTANGNLVLQNPSSVNIDVIEWSLLSADVALEDGPGGTANRLELYHNLGNPGAYAPASLPASVGPDSEVNFHSIIFELDESAPFSATFTIDGTAVVGQTSR